MKKLSSFLFVIILTNCSQTKQTTRPGLEVVRVKDGDTITVMASGLPVDIRLRGIDAPEISHRKKDPDQPFGQEAKAYLLKVLDNKNVRIEGIKKGYYGRLLSTIYLNGLDINMELVKQGLAVCYPEKTKSEECKQAQKHARIKRKGIWSQNDSITPKQWRKSHKKVKREQKVNRKTLLKIIDILKKWQSEDSRKTNTR